VPNESPEPPKRNLDTLDNLIKRHHDDRAIIFTANNDFAYDISQNSSSLHHPPDQD